MNRNLEPQTIDEETVVVFLQIPRNKTLEFQASIDLYESLATVRTMSIETSVVAVVTTPSLWEHCSSALQDLKSQIEWAQVTDDNQSYLNQLIAESTCANDS
jgi:hypothetical protein